MTVSGSTSAEALIPGNPTQIQQAIDTLSSGVDPARQIQTAWGSMQIPGWSGRAANVWKPFTPREAAYVGKTVTAMSMAAAALREYQTAFNVARAEAAAAILEAQAAEQATANAQTAYRDAVRKAADAKPGSPEAKPPTYTDPGAAPLANAQARLDAARTNLDTAGNTAAGIITTAGNMTSNVRPTITGAGHVRPAANIPVTDPPDLSGLSRLFEFFKGFVFEAVDLLRDNFTPKQLFDAFMDMFKTPEELEKMRAERLAIFDAFTKDPLGSFMKAMQAIWDDYTEKDLWEKHPDEAKGRVTFSTMFSILAVGGWVGKGSKAVGTATKGTKKAAGSGKSVTNGSKGRTSAGGGKITGKPPPKTKTTKSVPKVDVFLPSLPKTAPPLLGRGSTGRVQPKNLIEQLAMTEARTNPAAGKRLPIQVGDSRWPPNEGWQKMTINIKGVEIHYQWNSRTGAVDDYKFKN